MPTVTQPNADEQTTHNLQCLEIWGGNHAVDTGVSMPGIDAWVYSEPFEHTSGGGDVHYVTSCATGRIARVLLADVAGHGDGSSDLAVELRGLLRRHINSVEQKDFVNSLNREFCTSSNGYNFATGVIATYWGPQSKLSLCIAGHPLPILYRASSGEWSLLSPKTKSSVDVRNLPLGVDESARYEEFDVPLEEGDVLLLYTDALIETDDAAGDSLGEEGLLEAARKLDPSDPAELITRLREVITPVIERQTDKDDVTLMALRCNGKPMKTTPLVLMKGMWNMMRAKVGG